MLTAKWLLERNASRLAELAQLLEQRKLGRKFKLRSNFVRGGAGIGGMGIAYGLHPSYELRYP